MTESSRKDKKVEMCSHYGFAEKVLGNILIIWLKVRKIYIDKYRSKVEKKYLPQTAAVKGNRGGRG